jgi:sRNA-binding regulator protein Hfq
MEETKKKPKQNTGGPAFIPKLKGIPVDVELHTGERISGTIVGWNNYEILFLEFDTVGPYIIMKNYIACIIPTDDENNPLTPKTEEPCQTPQPSDQK